MDWRGYRMLQQLLRTSRTISFSMQTKWSLHHYNKPCCRLQCGRLQSHNLTSATSHTWMFRIASLQHARGTHDVLKHIVFELVMANKHVDLATLNVTEEEPALLTMMASVQHGALMWTCSSSTSSYWRSETVKDTFVRGASRDFIVLSLDGSRAVEERIQRATSVSILDHYLARPTLEYAQQYTMPKDVVVVYIINETQDLVSDVNKLQGSINNYKWGGAL